MSAVHKDSGLRVGTSNGRAAHPHPSPPRRHPRSPAPAAARRPCGPDRPARAPRRAAGRHAHDPNPAVRSARVPLCPRALKGTSELLLAYGHVDREGTGSFVVADELPAPGVTELVEAALTGRSRPAGARASGSKGGAGCPAEEPPSRVA